MNASPQTERRTNWITLAIFSVVVAIGLHRHEPWRDELQAWMIARASATPTVLLRNLRHEGHPFLWYATLWPFAKLHSSLWVLQLLQFCIAICTAAIVLWRSPFTRLQRTLLLFGYFTMFEYGILARSYGLGMLLAFAAMMFVVPTRRWLPFGCALGLLALTSAFGTILALAILIAVMVHDRDRLKARVDKGSLSAVAITVAGAAIAFAQARPSQGTSAFAKWHTDVDVHLGTTVIASVFRAFVPLQNFSQSWWNTSIADGSTGAAAVAGVAILGGIVYMWRTQFAAITLFGISTFGSVGFLYLKLGQADAARYFGVIWIAFVASAWLVAEARLPEVDVTTSTRLAAVPEPHPHPHKARLALSATTVFTVLAAMQVVVGFSAWARDFAHPFTDASATSTWLARHGGSRAVIVTCPDFAGSALAGYLDRPITYPQGARNGTFVIWDARRERMNIDIHAAVLLADATPNAPIYFVTNAVRRDLSSLLVFTRSRGIVADEHYWVYRIMGRAQLSQPGLCRTQ